MISNALLNKYYPSERYDGTKTFYDWISASLKDYHKVLNFGAGPRTYNGPFRLAAKEVIGVDIDPAVFANPGLDQAFVINTGGSIPVASEYIDIAYADFVLEHIEEPAAILSEIFRVLKPGGAFFFRTPNVYHYVAIISRLTPHSFHRLIANRVRGLPETSHDPWPTRYRMNSGRVLTEMAHKCGFNTCELRFLECQPSYLLFHPIPFMVGVYYERLVNSSEYLRGMRSTIIGRFDKCTAVDG